MSNDKSTPSDKNPDGKIPTPPPVLHRPWFANTAAILVLAVATLLVLGDILLADNGTIFSWIQGDLINQFVAWRRFGFTELADGHLALWNPYVFSGTPFLGGFQSALLYPPNWIYIFLPMHTAINGDITLHIFLSGVWTFCWVRRRGLHVAAATLAGLIYMFGGAHFMHVFAGHLPNLCAMTWTPLIFLGIDDITLAATRRGMGRGAWIGAGAVAMQILAGHPQYVYYTALIAGLYSLLCLIRSPRRAAAILGLSLMLAGAAALASAQLFTGFQALGECIRSNLSYDLARRFPFPPENLLTLISPDFYGNLADIPYWGRWLPWEDSAFIGVVALSLAIFGAVRAEPRIRRFSAAMIVVALLVAMGYYVSPIYRSLYHILPGFSSFRGVSKIGYLSLLFLAMLAAGGFDHLLRAKTISRRPPAILALAAVALTVVIVLIGISNSHGLDGLWFYTVRHLAPSSTQRDSSLNYTATFAGRAGEQAMFSLGICAVTCLAAALIWLAAGRRRSAVYGLALISGLELCVFAHTHRGSCDLRELTARDDLMQDFLNAHIDAAHADTRFMASPPGQLITLGRDDAWGSDPMILRRYAQAMAHGQGVSADQMAIAATFYTPAPIWRQFRIQYALNLMDAKPALVSIGLPTAAGPVKPWNALARVQLLNRYQVIPGDAEALALLDSRGFDASRTMVAPAPIDGIPSNLPPAPAGTLGSVTIKDITSDDVEISAQVLQPCVLLITDNYAAGWQVHSTDAAPSQGRYSLLRGDYCLRAIPLMPGAHHLRMVYRPSGWIVGRWISLAALAIYAAWGFAAFLDTKNLNHGGTETRRRG